MKNKVGYIYKTTNLITKEFYIGKRLYSKDKHLSEDIYFGSSQYIKNSIKEYGISNFKKEVLCECNTIEELDETETSIISVWSSNPLCLNSKSGIGFGGIYKNGNCRKCQKFGALWKDNICMSCVVGKTSSSFCLTCKKTTNSYPNGKCRSCVSKNSHSKRFCKYCQKETSFQKNACKNHRVILKRYEDGTIKMCKIKPYPRREEKILIPDIYIFNKLKWFYRGNSLEIILPRNEIKVKCENSFVSLNSLMINNKVSNWLKVYYKNKNGRRSSILLTTDHPLPVNENREVKEAKDLIIGDKLISSNDSTVFYPIVKIEKNNEHRNSYDISTETEYFNVNQKILSHNCRSLLSPYLDIDNNPKYWGRFNIGVITVNIPYIALVSKGNMDKFWKLLDKELSIIKQAHLDRVEFLSNATSDVAPILWQHGALARLDKNEKISQLFYNGYATISIGYAGIYEAVQYMIGESHTTEKGKQLAIEILTELNNYCDKFAKETGLYFSIYGTPLESTTGKFAKANLRDFGPIEEVTNHEYVTNSYHISPREEIDAFTKLEKEAVFQKLSTGGAISYIEAPDLSHNIEAVLEVIKYIYDNIMYAEINTRNDVCLKCDYHGEIQQSRKSFGEFIWECPNCSNDDIETMSIIRRTCGYLSSVGNGVNYGRLGDYNDRVFHL